MYHALTLYLAIGGKHGLCNQGLFSQSHPIIKKIAHAQNPLNCDSLLYTLLRRERAPM